MDCCSNESNVLGKEGKSDLTQILLWVGIAILGIIVLFVAFNALVASSSSTGAQAASSAGQAANSYGGMVGGC